ncbi:MAG: hypothetical protein M3256_26350, partial [Actinomycetota bacterium]|nr:hypothetical protein [Actinomycetota bacterium]
MGTTVVAGAVSCVMRGADPAGSGVAPATGAVWGVACGDDEAVVGVEFVFGVASVGSEAEPSRRPGWVSAARSVGPGTGSQSPKMPTLVSVA